jgi:transcriptional regulator with PAS, ATPase and Fis domain
MPGLLFYRGEREILRLPLTGPVFKIGRHPSNDLTLPDEEISRFHAFFELQENVYWVIDQSRNGTFVNGKRIQKAPLKDKDEIRAGGWRIVFTDEAKWGEKETLVAKAEKGEKTFPSFRGIIGKSEPMRRVFAMIEKAAPTAATVLIVGETGTGKELAARAIHELSPRERKPFVALNCGAISPQLIESEIFGHEKGAFTGAVGRHIGAFEQARGGTLFLDEVGELPLELQPKLLRVLEERRFRRVGGTEEIEADVRVIAATHRSLEAMCREGKFREDLYFRLFSVPIQLPPLRERKEDIPLLSEYFLEILQGNHGARKKLLPQALQRLVDYPWRGNVRELRNVITRSLLFASGDEIQSGEILFLTEGGGYAQNQSLENAEREAIVNALKESNWNKKKASSALGIAKSTLFHKIKQYQIKKPD